MILKCLNRKFYCEAKLAYWFTGEGITRARKMVEVTCSLVTKIFNV